ncbi:unnamed protein product [Chrysoparadoxa australica]
MAQAASPNSKETLKEQLSLALDRLGPSIIEVKETFSHRAERSTGVQGKKLGTDGMVKALMDLHLPLAAAESAAAVCDRVSRPLTFNEFVLAYSKAAGILNDEGHSSSRSGIWVEGPKEGKWVAVPLTETRKLRQTFDGQRGSAISGGDSESTMPVRDLEQALVEALKLPKPALTDAAR